MSLIEPYYRENRELHLNSLRNALKGDKAAAEDVVQEASYRAYKYESTFKGDDVDYRRWFSRIVFTCLSDFMRAKDGLGREQEVLPDTLEAPDERVRLDMLTDILSVMEDDFNLEQSYALSLIFVSGYSYPEVREITGLNIKALTNLCYRFRMKVKEQWKI